MVYVLTQQHIVLLFETILIVCFFLAHVVFALYLLGLEYPVTHVDITVFWQGTHASYSLRLVMQSVHNSVIENDLLS